MSTPVELARLVEEVSGNTVPEREIERTARLAFRLAREAGFSSLESYVSHLGRVRSSPEWRSLLAEITVKESSLFRAPAQFENLSATVLPALAEARAAERHLRLWSAGCARGEEAASLAIVLATNERVRDWDWRIAATDVDAAALEEAQRCEFCARAMSRAPEELVREHLTPVGDRFQLRQELRKRIDIQLLNLVDEPLQAPDGAPFDVIFLRNVLIYFRRESQQRVIRGVAANLAEDGFLFLGPSESLLGLSRDLRPMELDGCFCYRHASSTDDARPGRDDDSSSSSAPPAPDSTEAARPAPKRETGSHAARDAFEHGIRAVIGALKEGRPGEALDLLATAREYRPEDAGLRALTGLAHDRSGATERAVESFRAALYLDARLYQARLALADCLDRLGLPERARRERQRALTTLAGPEAREIPGSGTLGLPGPDEVMARYSG